MYFVYILYSEKCGRYYIGCCENLEARLDCQDQNMFDEASKYLFARKDLFGY